MKGELPVPQNWEDVDALGELMKDYNTSKIWAAVVDGDLGLQNGQQEFRNYYTNEFLEDDEIPWCLTCFHAQPNEPGVGCTYLEYDHSNDQYRGLGDYPCGDLDVITIDPEEKQECFVNFIEPEDCSRYSLCLIRNSSTSASYSLNLLILSIFVLLKQFLN